MLQQSPQKLLMNGTVLTNNSNANAKKNSTNSKNAATGNVKPTNATNAKNTGAKNGNAANDLSFTLNKKSYNVVEVPKGADDLSNLLNVNGTYYKIQEGGGLRTASGYNKNSNSINRIQKGGSEMSKHPSHEKVYQQQARNVTREGINVNSMAKQPKFNANGRLEALGKFEEPKHFQSINSVIQEEVERIPNVLNSKYAQLKDEESKKKQLMDEELSKFFDDMNKYNPPNSLNVFMKERRR